MHLYQIESVGDITYYAFSFLLIIFQWNLKVNLNLFLCAFSKSRLIIDQPWFMIYFQDEAVFAFGNCFLHAYLEFSKVFNFVQIIILISKCVIVLLLIAPDMGTSKSYFPVNFLRKSGFISEQLTSCRSRKNYILIL